MEQLQRNLADSLAQHLPKPELIHVSTLAELASADGIAHIAIPSNFKLEKLDLEGLLPNPRRTKATAVLGELGSFVDYVNRHAKAHSVVWCNFEPATYALSFTAVVDEHGPGQAGWRAHKATFTPAMSAEWITWTGQNKKPMDQLPFAEFIEANESDIASVPDMPTSLQMHQMATEFVARQDMSIKSIVRSQNGGAQLTYIADADAGTQEHMKVFERFTLGIPVFWQVPKGGEPVGAYPLSARLKYRLGGGKVSFFYELIRPDQVHQRASLELIEQVRDGIGEVPMLMGRCD